MNVRWRCLAQEQELLKQLQLEQDALVVGWVDGLTARTFETLGNGLLAGSSTGDHEAHGQAKEHAL